MYRILFWKIKTLKVNIKFSHLAIFRSFSTNMKFSVEVETECHLFDSIPDMMQEKPSPLHWDIQVEVMQKAMEEKKSATENSSSVKTNSVTTNSVSKKSVISSSITENSVLTQQTTTVAPTKTSTKKISSTSELLARMGKGKKVGEFTPIPRNSKNPICCIWLNFPMKIIYQQKSDHLYFIYVTISQEETVVTLLKHTFFSFLSSILFLTASVRYMF